MELREINHLAFITPDIEKTIRFYRDLLGMELTHGSPTSEPLGFDHVSFSVESKEALFSLKDRLEAAGIEVDGAVDHGTMWSIYFFDDHNIPLEATWDFMEILKTPVMEEDEPLDIVAEGAAPQPGHWPEVSQPTPSEEMTAHPGNGHAMRERFLREGLGRLRQDYVDAAE